MFVVFSPLHTSIALLPSKRCSPSCSLVVFKRRKKLLDVTTKQYARPMNLRFTIFGDIAPHHRLSATCCQTQEPVSFSEFCSCLALSVFNRILFQDFCRVFASSDLSCTLDSVFKHHLARDYINAAVPKPKVKSEDSKRRPPSIGIDGIAGATYRIGCDLAY